MKIFKNIKSVSSIHSCKSQKRVLLVQLSFFLFYVYLRNIIIPYSTEIQNFIGQYKLDQLGSPYRYRLLYFEFIIAINNFFPFLKFWYVFALLIIITFFFSLFQLFKLFELTLDQVDITLGLLVSTLLILITFYDHAFQPWSYLDIGLYAYGYRLIKFKKNFPLFCVIVFFAILNRETGVFLALIYFIHSFISLPYKINFSRNIILITVIFFTFYSIRYAKGYSVEEDSSRIATIFFRNLDFKSLLLTSIVLLSSGLFFAIPTYRHLHTTKSFIEVYFAILVFIPFYLIFGIWFEIRMLMPFLFIFAIEIIRKIK